MFHVPALYRIVDHPTHGSSGMDGNNGAFLVPLPGDVNALVIASDGLALNPPDQWEHVSVSIRIQTLVRTPTWDEMCAIKNMFWDADDCVVQFHPPRSKYVNTHPCVLHLWRSVSYRQPMPPVWLV